MTGEFNLLDEKWIRVMDSDYNIREVSLTEALIDAHRFRDLAGEMKTQDVAVLRLLLAVLHTVFSRVNKKGEPDPIEDKSTALDRWSTIWCSGQFPAEPIRQYLEGYRDRFYLFHPSYPFYQFTDAGNGAAFKAAKLNGELSESKRKPRLFPVRSGGPHDTLTYSEAARWLLFINGFDDTSAKEFGGKNAHIGWLGRIGLITAVGNNLFETLMLNLTLLKDGESVWGKNIPVWEVEPEDQVKGEIPIPDNPAELLTLQFRKIVLTAEDGIVTGYSASDWNYFSSENAFSEQMTIWRKKKNEDNVYIPKQHSSSIQAWRDFGSLIAQKDKDDVPNPGVIQWLAFLEEQEILSEEEMVWFGFCSARYDSPQSSYITDEFGDSLTFASMLLTEKGAEWQELVVKEIEKCEKRAFQVEILAKNLVRAAGGSESEAGSQGERAKEEFFYQLDMPFRNWLRSLEPWQDAQARDEKREEWNDTATGIARKFGGEMAEEAGPDAFVGREVTVTDKRENASSNYYCVPDALNRFQYQVTKIGREG